MIVRAALALILFAQVGCLSLVKDPSQPLPVTKVFDANVNQVASDVSVDKIDANAILLDARSPFDFSISHPAGAQNIQWSDYNQQTEVTAGLLDEDTFMLARKLSRLGIDPKKTVIVIGLGSRGNGEEGRIAWMLNYLGIEKVQTAGPGHFKSQMSNEPRELVKNAEVWKPILNDALIVDKEQFEKGIHLPKTNRAAPVIIDVRSEAEYAGKKGNLKGEVPDIGAINIPFKNFYTDTGLVNYKFAAEIQAIGISLDKEIWVISEKGLRSGAVTFSLRKMGFSKAKNFAGGYRKFLEKQN
jgi:thiosulfate/3-mercaptopyruvate sulfurtransferase